MSFYLSALLLGLALTSLGFGIFISMRIFNLPDITTDGSYTLGAVITALGLVADVPPMLIIPLVIFSGAVSGAVTGFVHARMGVNPLLAGILVMTALYSVNLTLLGRSNIPLIGVPVIYDSMPFISVPALRELVILVLLVSALLMILRWLLQTDFGLSMRATGSSETMMRALGVNTNNMKITGLAIANAFTALSGYLVCQYQGYTDINMGIGIVIAGLGSVMIGESLTFRSGKSSMWLRLGGIVAGSIVFRLLLAIALSGPQSP
jgi:putative tryptophan/tyrosine transport system permease protein